MPKTPKSGSPSVPEIRVAAQTTSRTKEYEKYLSGLQLDMSSWREQEARTIFKCFGDIEIIPRNRKKTADFVVRTSSLVVEVTTMNTPFDSDVEQDHQKNLNRVDKAILHITEKDYSDYPRFIQGGVIFYSHLLFTLANMWKTIQSSDVTNRILATELDFVVFIPEPVSVNGVDSMELYPPIVYVKKSGDLKLFKQNLPPNWIFEVI